MDDKILADSENTTQSQLQRQITRRQIIRAGGLAAIGLVFSKPMIDTIRPMPAFAAGYGPPGGGNSCCPNGLPSELEILAQGTHPMGPLGDAFIRIRGPKSGSSCCNAVVNLTVGIRSPLGSSACDALQKLVDQNRITVDTDGVATFPDFRTNANACRVVSNVPFLVTCDSTTGCRCYYNEAHLTVVRVRLSRTEEAVLEVKWKARVLPSPGTQCEVESSDAVFQASVTRVTVP